MGRLAVKIAGAATICVVLTSCAAISLVDTWRSPTVPAKRYQVLLVASLAKNFENRRVYEEILVGEFSRLGIKAVASNSVARRKGAESRQTLLEIARSVKADGLLTVQTVRVERITDVQPGYSSTFPDYGYSRLYPGYNYGYYGAYGYAPYSPYGYGYGSTTWYEPPTLQTYDVATIQANLFDSGSGKLTWAASMETMEPGRVVKVGKELAQIVTRSLVREGLI